MFFLLVFLRQYKLDFYFLNIVPFYTAALAIAVSWFWNRAPKVRPLIVLALAAVVGVNGLTISKRVRENLYRNDYLPAVAYLRSNAPLGGLIDGPSELAFGLGFQPHLDDDIRLGFYSRRMPDIIAIGRELRRMTFLK